MPKRPAKKLTEQPHGPPYALAQRLCAALGAPPSLQIDPPHERPGGLFGANAAFKIRDAEGRAFTVIVAQTHQPP